MVDRYWDQDLETLGWAQRREQMERRFLAFLEQTLKTSPAYADIYRQAGVEPGDIRGLEDLPRLPILHMEDLVRRQTQDPPFGGFCTQRPDQVRRIYVNPGFIWQPGPWQYQDTSWTQALAGAGFGPGDIVVNSFNYHLWPYAFMLDASLGQLGATAVPSGPGNTLMQAKIIKTLKATGFLGTPSFLMTIAQRAEAMGLDPAGDLNLKHALVGAEMLPDSLRRRMEQKLDLTVRQSYGTVLLGCLGFECLHLNGLHIPTDVLVEVVDPTTGQPSPHGTPGEVVATNFDPVFPLIRMGTGDLSMLAHGDCACGRSGPRLVKVLGRIDEAVKVVGIFVHPWQVDDIVSRHPEVFKYQVIIGREEGKDTFTFRIEPKGEEVSASSLAARLSRDVREELTLKCVVQVVPRGTIPDFHKKIVDDRSWD